MRVFFWLSVLILSLATILLQGCGGRADTVFLKYIHNRTAHQITFYFLPGSYRTAAIFGDSVVIEPFENKLLIEFVDKGVSVDKPRPCKIDGDSVYAQTQTGNIVNKHLHDEINWIFEGDRYQQKCTMAIDSTDIL